MKYAVKMRSCAAIGTPIPSFIKIGSGIQKLIKEGIDRHADRMVIS
jgi:hypothetical protein